MKGSSYDPRDPGFWREYSRRLSSEDSAAGYLKGRCWDKAASTYDDLESCRDYVLQVEAVIGELKESGALFQEGTVFDVACGTGTYALRMARHCKDVVALDISRAMLEELERKREKLGLKNIETVHADWNTFETTRSFDLVFVSMTPILRDLGNVDRFLDVSRRFLAIVCWAGVRENRLFDRIQEEILGCVPGKQAIDVLIPFNYLCALGYAPSLRFFHGCWERTRSVDRQVEAFIWQLEMRKRLTGEERQLVRRMVARHARDGLVRVYTRVRIGFLLLDKEAGKAPCPPGNG